MKLLIGNKPYKNINFDDVIDSFENNCRFNCHILNQNNGSKCDELGTCGHVYNSIKNTFDFNTNLRLKTFDWIYNKYKHVYKREKMKQFYDCFKPNAYKKIFYLKPDNYKINLFLKSINCPFSHKSEQPRTGFSGIMREVMNKNKVFLSHFTIKYDEARASQMTLKVCDNSGCHVNAAKYEIQIIRWLHKNNYIDATLCMLEDTEKVTFNYDDLKPSKFILDKFKHL